MCRKIRDLLEQWSVAEDIIKEFERNDMKVDILQYLIDDDIKTLIPKIGAQISFRKKLKDFLNRENNQIKESNEIRCEKNILHKEKDNAENESSLKNTNIIIDTDKNQCATAQSLFIDVKTIAWNEHDFNGMEMSILGEESGNDDKESIFHNFEESPRKKQKLLSENVLTDPNESLMSNKTGESGINKTATLKDVEKSTQEYNYLTGRKSDYDLEHVLKDSVKGHTVLSAYLFQGELDEKHRNILADIIVHHELRDNLNFRVTSERAEFIAEKIIKLFPKEEKDTWILREKNRKGKSVGRGKILIKFQTIRRNLIKSGAIKESKKQSNNEEEREEIDDYCEDADCEQYILWLQNNDKPWIKVTQLWEKTSKIRLKSLQSSNQNIQDYMKLYSALEEPQGYTLLEKDFEKLYPEAHMKLYAEWAKLSAFIEQKVAKIDPKFKTHSNPDKKTVQLLSKLPSLFPVYTAIVGKGKGCNWRPSLCERREAFLWRIETYGDLKAKIKERREKLNHFKLTLQPQAVIIGSSETDIRHSVVIIDKIHYEVETPLKAIDIAFKCIYSLHAEYPKESEQVYLFLQTGIYGISTKYDKKFNAVSTLIKEYKNFSFFIDKSSKPPFILQKHLNNLTLKMSAAQTLCFVKYFGLLVGDLIPDNDSFWLLYRLLREIIDIVYAKSNHKNHPNILRVLVNEHHKLYLKITNDNLKPKYHELVHYPNFMANVGPVSQFSCYKFEAKHKFLKKLVYVNSCRKNTAYSVAVKHQLHMSYRFINSSSIFPSLIIGPKKNVNKYKVTKIIALLPDNIKNNFIISNWIEYKGTRFHENLIVMIDENESGPLFGSIDAVIVSQNIVIFHCEILTTIGFNEHIRGYEVRFSETKRNVNIEDFSDPLPISLHKNVRNEKYVMLRYAI